MADLPTERLSIKQPFTYTSVDYSGLIYIKFFRKTSIKQLQRGTELPLHV